MTDAPTAATPDTPPAPDPTGAAKESRVGRLLALVRKLIDYGRELAATLHGRDPATHARHFGTTDIALILARITQGLHRARALEERLVNNAARLDTPPVQAQRAASPRQSRPATAQPTDTAAAPDALVPGIDPGICLPTPEQIAAKIRRQPIGAVIADICRDLGILPSHPLWRELSVAIIRHGGSRANLVKDILDQAFPTSATTQLRLTRCPPAPLARFPAPVCTGPP